MATLTITTTSAQDARIIAAFGKYLNTQDFTDPENPIPRNATAGEVKNSLINFLRGVVFNQERKEEIAVISLQDLNPT